MGFQLIKKEEVSDETVFGWATVTGNARLTV